MIRRIDAWLTSDTVTTFIDDALYVIGGVAFVVLVVVVPVLVGRVA